MALTISDTVVDTIDRDDTSDVKIDTVDTIDLIDALPDDVISIIMRKLDLKNFIHFRMTCKRINKLAEEPYNQSKLKISFETLKLACENDQVWIVLLQKKWYAKSLLLAITYEKLDIVKKILERGITRVEVLSANRIPRVFRLIDEPPYYLDPGSIHMDYADDCLEIYENQMKKRVNLRYHRNELLPDSTEIIPILDYLISIFKFPPLIPATKPSAVKRKKSKTANAQKSVT